MDCPINLHFEYINHAAVLPYGLTVDEVNEAVGKTYKFFHGLNSYLEDNDLNKIEHMLLSNTVSGIISEVMIKNIAESSDAMMRNDVTGGHPDLLSKEEHKGEAHQALHGIEIKASTKSYNWQGHNKESGWLMVFRYTVKDHSFRFTEILCAELEEDDWTFAGRGKDSRRTPTASINGTGIEKLRSNFLYRLPGFGVGRHRHILAETNEVDNEGSNPA